MTSSRSSRHTRSRPAWPAENGAVPVAREDRAAAGTVPAAPTRGGSSRKLLPVHEIDSVSVTIGVTRHLHNILRTYPILKQSGAVRERCSDSGGFFLSPGPRNAVWGCGNVWEGERG